MKKTKVKKLRRAYRETAKGLIEGSNSNFAFNTMDLGPYWKGPFASYISDETKNFIRHFRSKTKTWFGDPNDPKTIEHRVMALLLMSEISRDLTGKQK